MCSLQAECLAACQLLAPSLRRPVLGVDRVPPQLGETATGFRAVDPGNNTALLQPHKRTQTNIPPTQSSQYKVSFALLTSDTDTKYYFFSSFSILETTQTLRSN